jgi:glucosamine--fructose-6-phosphate aminotransferase (isomerizing)
LFFLFQDSQIMNLETLQENAFLKDILAQPNSLHHALAQLDFSLLEPLAWALHKGEIDRVVLTGMGASYYALYTAWLHLAAAGYPAIWVDCAELVHHTPGLISPKTMLMVASQSGRSAEIVALLGLIAGQAAAGSPPAGLLAITNDLGSPLAEAAHLMAKTGEQQAHPLRGVLLPLYTEPELAVSTRTFVNTLAIAQLAALALCSYAPRESGKLHHHFSDLESTIDGMDAYLSMWEDKLDQVGKAVGAPGNSPLILVGRGLSVASACEGALNIEESAKLPAIGLQAAEFRHGPLEIVGHGLTGLVFAGEPGVRDLNYKLWTELREKGMNALWVEPPGNENPSTGYLPMPSAAGIGLPLAEIVPVQLLCVHLCLQLGLTPGQFRYIEKVTTDL